MKLTSQINAKVLPTVLVIGTVMLLTVLIGISLSDLEWQLIAGKYATSQREAFLESALLVYQLDSTLVGNNDNKAAITLFEDNPNSTVTISKKNWGLYELIKVETKDNKLRKVCLMGNRINAAVHPALYVCDHEQAFTLAGNSNIKGMAYLPENGLLYSQIESDFFSGEYVESDFIKRSSQNFPPIDKIVLEDFHHGGIKPETHVLNRTNLQMPFSENTLVVRADNICASSIKGNIIIISNSKIVVDGSSCIEDAIIISPKVILEKGFRGSVQIISSDTVSIESGVQLNFPSGIIIPEGNPDSYIAVGSQSEVNGYVIFQSKEAVNDEYLSPHYHQCDSTRVRGLVWIDGIAQIQGGITGSLYVRHSNYYTSSGYYRDVLLNTKVYGSDAMAFPVWMITDYKKKLIKWLE